MGSPSLTPFSIKGSASAGCRLLEVPPGYAVRTPAPRLLDRVRQTIRARHYSPRTEKSYVAWIRRYVVFHGKRHPSEMGTDEVRTFLSWLATEKRVSASTQNQALSALLFLYRDVPGGEIGWIDKIVPAKRSTRLPVVLTPSEVRSVLGHLKGTSWLMASLMYGTGLRLMECCRLRAKDVDFGRREIVVRDGKGRKDRVTMLPDSLKEALQVHLVRAKEKHARDLTAGTGAVALPGALDRKYPAAAREWGWQWVFPAARFYADRETGELKRHHRHESVLQRDVKDATRKAGITKPASCHTLRHSFCDALAAVRHRHPDDPGTARPPGRDDNDDLHPCSEQGRAWREEPVGPVTSNATQRLSC